VNLERVWRAAAHEVPLLAEQLRDEGKRPTS